MSKLTREIDRSIVNSGRSHLASNHGPHSHIGKCLTESYTAYRAGDLGLESGHLYNAWCIATTGGMTRAADTLSAVLSASMRLCGRGHDSNPYGDDDTEGGAK